MALVELGKVLVEQRATIGIPNGNDLPLIGVSNQEGLIRSKQERLADVSRYKILRRGWFAYNPMRINVGSIGIADTEEKTGIISPDYVVFSCGDQILPEYFYFFIKSEIGLSEIAKKTGGSVRERLYFKSLAKIHIYLPSIDEQRRILDRLKYIQQAVDTIRNECDVFTESDLADLRKAILQEAILGKLVPQDPNNEPASELLKKIKAEKERFITRGKVKKEKPLLPITPEEIPFDLPNGWVWCRLGEVGEINPRNDFDENFEAGFIPMTRISSEFGVAPSYEFRNWSQIKSGFTHFANNDVGVAKITPCFENSKAAVFKNLPNGMGAGTTELHIFRPISDFIDSEYVYIFFKSPEFLKAGAAKMTGSAGQKRVPTDFVRNALFPLPPKNEQLKIVRKVNLLIESSRKLGVEIVTSHAEARKLLQVILQEAFEGKEIEIA